MRPQQTRGLGKSRPDRPDKEKPEKNGGKEEDLLPLSGCGIWGAACRTRPSAERSLFCSGRDWLI